MTSARGVDEPSWLMAALEVSQDLLQRTDTSGALRVVAERALAAGSYELAVVCVPTGGDTFTFVAAGTQGYLLDGLSQSAKSSLFAIVDTGQPAVAPARELPQLLGPTAVALRVGPGLLLPLASGAASLGFLFLARSPGAPAWSPADISAAALYAHHAAGTLQLLHAHEARVGRAIEASRTQTAADLEDDVTASLATVEERLRALAATAPEPPVSARLRRIGDELVEAVTQIRRTVGPPAPLPGSADVAGRVARTVRDLTPALGFPPTVRIEGRTELMPPVVADNVVAVLSELVSNTARHAGATEVTAAIRVQLSEVTVSVADNGTGARSHRTGSGLSNLRARAERLGGAFEVTFVPAAGTTAVWRVPLWRGCWQP